VLIRVRGEILTKRVNLFLALGGDFEIPEEAVEETVQTGSDQ